MRANFQLFSSRRFGALLRKEFAQIRRDRRLAMSLILPPILQLLLFSVVLNATVSDLRLGVIDESRTSQSRDLVSTLTESRSFRLAGYYDSVSQLGDAISRGDLDAGVVIPRDFARDLERGRPVTVQLLLNAMNANTATIARSYAQGVILTWNQGLSGNGLHARFSQIDVSPVSRRGRAVMTRAFLFNPGLVEQLVCGHRGSRAAAHLEWVHCRGRRHGERAGSGHDRTARYVAGGDVRDHCG